MTFGEVEEVPTRQDYNTQLYSTEEPARAGFVNKIVICKIFEKL